MLLDDGESLRIKPENLLQRLLAEVRDRVRVSGLGFGLGLGLGLGKRLLQRFLAELTTLEPRP